MRTIATQDITQGPELHAGFEYVRANIEDAIFDQVGTIRDWNPQGTPGDLMSGNLDGCDPDKRIGASVLLHVMAGDQVNLRAYGYYESTDSTDMNTYPVSSEMLTALTNALTGGGAVTGGGDLGTGISTGTINTLLNSTNYAVYDALKNSVTDPNYPRTYLNYLVFNEGMDIQADQCKVVQLTGSPNTWNLMQFSGNMNITANGYVLCYLSNESCMQVSVDNENIITVKGRLMEEQHYYPHGLVVEDGGQQNTPVPNKFLFESNKMQGELGLELFDFNARNYDQQIGRFTAVVPLADDGQEQWSPYHFVGGDPANFTDPEGLERGGGNQNACPKNVAAPSNNSGNGFWKAIFGFFEGSGEEQKFDESGFVPGYSITTPGLNGSGLPSAAAMAVLSGPASSGSSSSATPRGGSNGSGPGKPNPNSYGPDNPENYWKKKMADLSNKVEQMFQPKIGVDNSPVKNELHSGVPDSKTIVLDHVIYDLESFSNFYDYNKRRYIAKKFKGTTLQDKSELMIDMKPYKPYAEVSADLMIENNTVRVKGNGEPTNDRDMMISPGRRWGIHTHPPAGYFSYRDPSAVSGYRGGRIDEGVWKVDRDVTWTNPYFDVIVDNNFIYLYRGKEEYKFDRKTFKLVK